MELIYQGLSDLGGKFSYVDGKPGVSGSRIFGSQFLVSSRIFGCYFFCQNGSPPFVMGKGYPPPESWTVTFTLGKLFETWFFQISEV